MSCLRLVCGETRVRGLISAKGVCVPRAKVTSAVMVVSAAMINILGLGSEVQPVAEINHQPTRCISFSPDGSKLAVGGANDNRAIIRIIDTDSWQPTGVVALPGREVMALAFSADNTLLFATADSDVVVIRVSDLKEMSHLSRHTDLVLAIATSSDGRYVATAGQDGRVCLWDGKRLMHVRDLDRHADKLFALAFDARGRQLATVGKNIFRIWPGLKAGEFKDVPFVGSGHHVCYSPEGEVVVAATVSGHLIVANCDHLTRAPHDFQLGPYIGGIGFGSRFGVVLAGVNRDLALFSVKHGRVLKWFSRHESRIGGIAVDTSNAVVAVGSWDGVIRIWKSADIIEASRERGRNHP